VLDVHAIALALVAGARARARGCRSAPVVERLIVTDGRVVGARLVGGGTIEADEVVLAVGAWSASLGGRGLADPDRAAAPSPRAAGTVATAAASGRWSGGSTRIYVRREAGGLLASRCDEQVWRACRRPRPRTLEQLAVRLRAARAFARFERGPHGVACLRSFTPDGTLVAGRDSRARGLTWIAGLGGRGMSVGLGLGEVAAAAALDEPHALAEALAPGRWFRG
jgi:glycine/D-amino acid oxidase-like deaminating enzyme